MSEDSANWAKSIVEHVPGYEADVFARYSQRLLAFAQSRLPSHLTRRLDADDVVQSVFRSFFRRNEAGEFHFEESHDVWQLLAAMTYRKVVNASIFHHREARNVARERPIGRSGGGSKMSRQAPLVDPQPGPEDFAILLDYFEWIINKLPEPYQQIVQLRMEGLSIAEISEEVKLSQRTIKRVLAHVRELAANGQREE